MPAPTKSPDDKNKELNPSEKNYEQVFEEGNFEQRLADTPSQDDVAKGLSDAENYANKEGAKKTSESRPSSDSLREKEQEGAKGDWNQNYTGSNNKSSLVTKAKLTRRLAIFGGAGGIIGAIVFILSGFLPLGGLIINLTETGTVNRDSQHTILSKRLYKVIDSKISNSVTDGSCSVVKIACRFSRPSNALLSRLDDYGIKAYKGNNPIEKKALGFPNEKPDTYRFTRANGTVETISARDFASRLRTDVEFNKSFTRAFNMRYWGYADQFIKDLFYKKVGIDRSGKTTTGIDSKDPHKSVAAIADNADKNNPVRGASDADAKRAAVTNTLTEEITDEVERSARKVVRTGGDPILAVGTLACIGLNIPGFITKVVRAYQMRQEIVLASTLVLTAASMIKSGDVDPATVATIGTLLTASSIRPDGTKTKSAMDSFGIKNILFGDAVSPDSKYKKFIPGGAIMQQNKGINELANNPAMKEACQVVASPQAQVTVAVIEGAVSASTLGFGAIVLGALKAGGWALTSILAVEKIMEYAGPVITDIVKDIVKSIPPEEIANFLGNPDIANAKEEDLGNVLGSGMSFFFSNAALSTGSAPLTQGQLAAFTKASTEENLAYAEQDRFGRSPFDVSSPYTFLGSIVSNFYRTSYIPNNIFKTIASTIGTTLSKPFKLLDARTYAATDDIAARCGHAEEFGVDADVAIGPFSDICAGIPAQYLDIPTQNVVSAVTSEIDADSGQPKEDGEIAAMLSECSEGDLRNAKGCTITDQERANHSIYMYDLRINDMLDGVNTDVDRPETTPATEGSAGNTGRPAGAVDAGRGWTMPNNGDFSKTPCDPRTPDAGVYTNRTYGFTVRLCTVTLNTPPSNGNGSSTVSSVISTNVMNMLEAAQAAGHPMGITDAMRKTGAGSYSQHKYGLALDLGAPRGGQTICYGGDPRYGYGSLANAQAACRRIGGAHYAAYEWLTANAAKYGFYNYGNEPWHWSTSGM